MAQIADESFKRAILNVAGWGDTDVFPFPIENHIFYDLPDDVLGALRALAASLSAKNTLPSEPFSMYSCLAPVGYHGFRWATQIEPIWNAYLLGAVLQIAPQIEASRLSESDGRVYSYRFRSAPHDGLFASDGWRDFQSRCRALAEEHAYVVAVDIADFYARVYHHPMENAIQAVDDSGNLHSTITQVLARLSGGTSYGLPVGGPAARMLAELLLDTVDRLLLIEASTKNFVRYADDYRFFVNTLPDAYRAIGYLSEKLQRNQGLSLQKSKTRIMKSAEYISILDPVELPAGSAAKFLSLHIHFDPYSATPVEDYERLNAKIQEFDILGMLRHELTKGRVNAALTRRLVGALKFMDGETRWQALLSLLENVDTLAPVWPQVMLAFRDCLKDLSDERIEQAHEEIRRLINENHHVAQIDLNLSYMVRVLGQKHSSQNAELLMRIYGGPHGFGSGPAPNLQRDIMLTLAKWNVRFWLSDQKSYVESMHPWVKRAFIIASSQMGDEGRFWRTSARRGYTPFEEVIKKWVGDKMNNNSWEIPI
ncbi:RNA-directed DNA polymerase [Kribbella sp. NPDC051770]|uniref:RNA-directed DNA polymerase n=1 Tax=Kribbella sp. NPDC051770 TaxID=3155413 RepID=UPI0034131F70